MSAKALSYAENVLGVHEVFTETVSLVEELEGARLLLDKAQADRRGVESAIRYREVELIQEKRSTHPSMSDTRFKSEFRIWEIEDVELVNLRLKLEDNRFECDSLETQVEILRVKIKVGSARIAELGGYLNYLAAVKTQAEHSKKTTGEKR